MDSKRSVKRGGSKVREGVFPALPWLPFSEGWTALHRALQGRLFQMAALQGKNDILTARRRAFAALFPYPLEKIGFWRAARQNGLIRGAVSL